jgi:hypothetical protein
MVLGVPRKFAKTWVPDEATEAAFPHRRFSLIHRHHPSALEAQSMEHSSLFYTAGLKIGEKPVICCVFQPAERESEFSARGFPLLTESSARIASRRCKKTP